MRMWWRRLTGLLRGNRLERELNEEIDVHLAMQEEEFRRQGILGARPWPVENRTNKLVRIRRLGPYLSSRRLRFKNDSPGTRLLVEQLQEFPIGDHDDGPDAAEMALRLVAELLAAAPARVRPRRRHGHGPALRCHGRPVAGRPLLGLG